MDLEFVSWEDLEYIYTIPRDGISNIDSSFIDHTDENGVYFYTGALNDGDGSGLPDFVDSYLGVDITLNPSQGVAHG